MHRGREVADRVDAVVDALQAAVAEPVFDAFGVNPRRHELPAGHPSVLARGDRGGDGEQSPHTGC